MRRNHVVPDVRELNERCTVPLRNVGTAKEVLQQEHVVIERRTPEESRSQRQYPLFDVLVERDEGLVF